MGQERALPSSLMINAFTGAASAQGALSERSLKWTLLNAPPTIRAFLRAAPKADLRNWRDERVGWGLVLPYNPKLSEKDQATAVDAPEPVQELVRSRGAP